MSKTIIKAFTDKAGGSLGLEDTTLSGTTTATDINAETITASTEVRSDSITDSAGTGGPDFPNGITIGSAFDISDYDSARTDITALVPGTPFGALIESVPSGHVVVGIDGNDNNDSFSVLTSTDSDGLYSRKPFSVNNIGATVDGTLDATDINAETVTASTSIKSDTMTDEAGTGAPDFPNGWSVAGGDVINIVDTGFWTPAYTASGSANISGTPTSNQSFYMRVNNLVFFSMNVTIQTTANNASSIALFTLPVGTSVSASSEIQGTMTGLNTGATVNFLGIAAATGALNRIALRFRGDATNTNTTYNVSGIYRL